MLINYLKGIEVQIKEDEQKMDVDVPEETKLPAVPYDQDIKKGPQGPDNFRRFRAGLDDMKDKIKEVKKDEKMARKSKDPETLEKC